MTRHNLVLVDEALFDCKQVGLAKMQIKESKRSHVKVRFVSDWKDIRRACQNRKKMDATSTPTKHWDTISLWLQCSYDDNTKHITTLDTDLCVDVRSDEYKHGRAYKQHKRTIDLLRTLVPQSDDACTYRGVYIHACKYGSIPGVRQFFHTSDEDLAPVYLSVNETWHETCPYWQVKWGSNCGYEPKRSQRKHAQQHLFDDIQRLTFGGEKKTDAKAIADKVAADKVAADKVIADKVAADKVATDKAGCGCAAAAKAIADKAAADKVAADKVIADKAGCAAAAKAAADKVAADKVIADKAAADKVIADKAAADKVAADKVIADKAAADKAAAEKAAAAKVIADKAAADKVIADKAAADKVIADKAAADKVIADKAAADKAAADKAAADKALCQ